MTQAVHKVSWKVGETKTERERGQEREKYKKKERWKVKSKYVQEEVIEHES